MKKLVLTGVLVSLVASCAKKNSESANNKKSGDEKSGPAEKVEVPVIQGKLVARERVYMPFTVAEPMKISFNIVGTSKSDIENYRYEGEYLGAVEEDKKKLDESFFGASFKRVKRRDDGLYDYEFIVPFNADSKIVGGVKLSLIVDDLNDSQGNPAKMTTEFLLDENSYNTIHKNASSVLKDYSVLQEDVFGLAEGEEITLMGLIERVLNGEDPVTGDQALEDVTIARQSWAIETHMGARVLVPKKPVHVSISYPGEVIIYNRHAVPISLVSDDASKVTIYMASCKKLGSCDVSKPDLRLLTMKAPRVKTIEGAFDGVKGADADYGAFTTCSQELYKKNLPRERALCENQFESFNGNDYQFNFQLLTANAGFAAMSVGDIKSHLKVRADDNLWNIEYWKNRTPTSCNNQNCIVTYDEKELDFFGQKMDATTMLGTVASMFDETLSTDEYKEHVKKEFAQGKSVLESVKNHESRFHFGDNNENRAGFSEAWDHPFVQGNAGNYGWADEICKKTMVSQVESWVSPNGVFQDFRGGMPHYLTKQLAGYDVIADGSISNKVKLDDYLDLRYVKLISAGISKVADSESSELSVIPFISKAGGRGEHYADFEKIEQPNGDIVLVVPQKVIEDMSPIAEKVVLDGNVGEKGFSSPSASIVTGNIGTLAEDLKGMVGTYGEKGKDWIKDVFYSGRAEWRATYENGESLPSFLFVPTATGKGACDIESLKQGLCQYEYFPKRVVAKQGDKFEVSYHVSELEGEVVTPFKMYNSIEGVHLVDRLNRVMPAADFLGLYGVNPELVTKHGLFQLAETQPTFGRGNRGDGGDSVSLRYFEGGTGATGFFSLYDVEDPQVRPHGFAIVAAITVAAVALGAYEYGNSNSKVSRNFRSYSFGDFVKANYSKNNDGVYEIMNESVITTGEKLKVSCKDFVQDNDGRFYDEVLFTPQYLPAGLSREKFNDTNLKTTGLMRPLDLGDGFLGIMEAEASKYFPEEGEYRNVVTTCDESFLGACKTEVEFLASVSTRTACNGVYTKLCSDPRSESTWEKAIIHWFSGRQSNYLNGIKEECSNKLNESRTGYEETAKNFVEGIEKFQGLLDDLLVLKPHYFKAVLGGQTTVNGNPVSFNPMYSELKPFSDRYFTVEDLPANIQKYVRLKKHDLGTLTLPELYAVAMRLSSYSETRRQLDEFLAEHGKGKHKFSWQNLGNIDLPGDKVDNYIVDAEGQKKTLIESFSNKSTLQKVYNTWNTLPSVEEVNRLVSEIANVIKILSPKVKNLSCRYSINGVVKKYDNPYFKKESVNFINPSKHTSDIELSAQKWENTFGNKAKVVKIRAFETPALHREVRFERSRVGHIGDVTEPMISPVPTCADLGNVAWDKGIPMARIMHQRKDCGAN